MIERSYEVYGHDGARWLIDSVHDYKQDAIRRCEELAADPRHPYERLQVCEEGRFKNRAVVVHEQACARGGEPAIRVQPIDEAPYCQRQIDYYLLQARRVIARLLRPFLDREQITVLELLHDYGRLRRLLRDDHAYPQALGRVAAIQAREAGVSTAQRSAEIDRVVEAVVRRARYDQSLDILVKILEAGEGLSAVWAELPPETGAAERIVKTQAALARYLRQRPGWSSKLAALLDLAARDRNPEALETLDGAVADLLDSREALRDILGASANLGEALCVRIALARGEAPPRQDGGAEEVTAQLAAAITDLPNTQEVILSAVAKALATTQPLTRQGGEAERIAFRRVVTALSSVGGLVGGPEMADALTRRARTVHAQDGEDLPPAQGVKTVTRMLTPRAAQIGYLLALAASPFGQRHRRLMISILAGTLKGLTGRRSLLPEDADAEITQDMVQELRAHLAALEADTDADSDGGGTATPLTAQADPPAGDGARPSGGARRP